MTTKDDLETMGRALGLLVGQVEGIRSRAVESAVRSRAAIDAATLAELRAIEAQALAAQTRDELVGLQAELLAIAQTLTDPGPVDPDPGPGPTPTLPVLVHGPDTATRNGILTRSEFHQTFQRGAGLTGEPFKAWQSKAGAQKNAGEWWGYEGGIAVRMNPANPQYERAGSSESHEAWLYWDRRYRQARMDLELKLVEPFVWPLTGKVAGIVGWNGDWNQWPGGGRSGPDNASVRLILNDWGHQGNARLGAYLYLGGVFDQGKVTGPNANYVSNGNHSVEYLLHEYGVPSVGSWIPIRIDTTCDTDGVGDLLVTIEGREVLAVGGLPWFVGGSDRGWNTGYVCGLFGGDAPEYNPAGGSRTIAYRNLVWSGR
jgi:hypothetical protein